MEKEVLERYSVIHEKNPREIVLLRGSGCEWRKCRFCDYHLDSCKDQAENDRVNQIELDKVTGLYQRLEVINSGSFIDLSEESIALIEEVCIQKGIREIHFECHWMHREEVAGLRRRFEAIGIKVIVKIGVETFDSLFRESYLVKGIDTDSPEEIGSYFDECCLLQGIPGQTVETMKRDIETGLQYFQRVCVNIMQKNEKPILPDPRVIEVFVKEIYPIYKENKRVDILLSNTDFGVGGVTTDAE